MRGKRILKRCYVGSVLKQNRPAAINGAQVLIKGTDVNQNEATIGLGSKELVRGILVEGASGMGKTELMKKIGKGLRDTLENDYTMIVLETKEDYFDSLSREGDILIGQGQYKSCSVRWNLFKDMTYEGWDDDSIRLNCKELAKYLTTQTLKQHMHSQDFFINAAQLLIESILVTYIQKGRKNLKERQNLTNKGLREFFSKYSPEQYVELVESCTEPGGLRMILGEDINNLQALGALGEAAGKILTVFSDVFAEDGDFSIREFIHEKNGRALFLKYDYAYKETQQQIYSLLINQMIKEMLSHKSTSGHVIFLCDELASLGKIDLVSAVNMGRSKGFICVAGIQSVEQIYELYGEHAGNAMLAGFETKFLFAPNDVKTAEFIQKTFGENLVEYMTLSAGGTVCRCEKGHVVEDEDLNNMNIGDCIVSYVKERPFLFRVSLS